MIEKLYLKPIENGQSVVSEYWLQLLFSNVTSKRLDQMSDGIVLYTDGSFRDGKAGWGVHGYTYINKPMTSKTSAKQQPTSMGYKDVDLPATCTVVDYIDAFGGVEFNPTNNTAELNALINAFKIAKEHDVPEMVVLLDSEYVRKGLTEFSDRWQKNGWLRADGSPVVNVGYWKELISLRDDWVNNNKTVDFKWVRGHSNDLGNDKADENAALGTGQEKKATVSIKIEADKINKLKKVPLTPLVLESRLLFSINKKDVNFNNTYYMYNLGQYHRYAVKKDDTIKEKFNKTDLLLGRRISEATFGVFIAKEPEEYIESLFKMHIDSFATENPELGVINLANASKAAVRQKIETMGVSALEKYDDISVLATPNLELISKTLNPPRLANDAISQFNILETRLREYLGGTLGESVSVVDVTNSFFEEVTKGKKTIHQLLKSITSTTSAIEVPIKFKGKSVKLKLVLTIDIPSRNQLARIGAEEVKMDVLIVPTGPMAYSYSTVFVTEQGAAIYQSPYTQFILPK